MFWRTGIAHHTTKTSVSGSKLTFLTDKKDRQSALCCTVKNLPITWLFAPKINFVFCILFFDLPWLAWGCAQSWRPWPPWGGWGRRGSRSWGPPWGCRWWRRWRGWSRTGSRPPWSSGAAAQWFSLSPLQKIIFNK